MYNAKQIKRMVLEREICLNEKLEHRVINDQMTEDDISFVNRSLEEKKRIEKFITGGDGG